MGPHLVSTPTDGSKAAYRQTTEHAVHARFKAVDAAAVYKSSCFLSNRIATILGFASCQYNHYKAQPDIANGDDVVGRIYSI